MPQIELPSGSFHYDEFGSGEELLWLTGGGGVGAVWHPYQMPYFERFYRNVTFDNRGVGGTVCTEPEPWTIADMARDAAAIIETILDPPVVVCGKSMGGFIGLQLLLDRPDLCRAGHRDGGRSLRSRGLARRLHAGGGRATATGRAAGGHVRDDALRRPALPGAGARRPRRVGADPAVLGAGFNDQNERSLIPQWQACIDFDLRDRLPECSVPLHVISFDEDVQAPPQLGEEVARLAPTAQHHLFEGMGHGSVWGHTHAQANPLIKELVDRYISARDDVPP